MDWVRFQHLDAYKVLLLRTYCYVMAIAKKETFIWHSSVEPQLTENSPLAKTTKNTALWPLPICLCQFRMHQFYVFANFGHFDRISTFSWRTPTPKTVGFHPSSWSWMEKNPPTPMSPDVSSHFCAEKRSAMGWGNKLSTLQWTITYPTEREQENHRLKSDFWWDMVVPRRVCEYIKS